MFGKVLAVLAALSQYYRWFIDSPIKNTMPIFTEWLIPEALGLHTEVWLRASASLESEASGSTGFHRRYRLELGVAEREAQDWEQVRVEVSWRVPRAFFVDPWGMEREGQVVLVSSEEADVWVRWNTDDLKQAIDLEVPAYSPKAQDFTLRASLYVRKHDPSLKQYTY